MRNFYFLTHFSSPYFPLENYQDSDSLRIIRITRDFVEIEKRNLYAGKIRVIRVIDYSRSLPSLFFCFMDWPSFRRCCYYLFKSGKRALPQVSRGNFSCISPLVQTKQRCFIFPATERSTGIPLCRCINFSMFPEQCINISFTRTEWVDESFNRYSI